MIEYIEDISPGISKIKINNEVKFVAHGIAGEEASKFYQEMPEKANFNEEELFIMRDSVQLFKIYTSLVEANAFWDGVNATEGCLEATGTSFNDHIKIYP